MPSSLNALADSIVIDPKQSIGPKSETFVKSIRRIDELLGLTKIKDKITKHLRHAVKQVERGTTGIGFHNIIITGEPGRGKTQLAQRIGEAFIAMGFYKTVKNEAGTVTLSLRDYLQVMRMFRRNAETYDTVRLNKNYRNASVEMKRRRSITSALANACIHNAIFYGNPLAKDSTVAIDDILQGKYNREIEKLPNLEITKIENTVMEVELNNQGRPGKCRVFSKGDIVAGYIGQTAIKTLNALRSCRGGVFILDEAYSLLNVTESQNDKVCTFGLEALNAINQYLSENQTSQMVILCGYKKLIDALHSVQRGLYRRFNWFYDIDDYTIGELVSIYMQKVPRHLSVTFSESDLENVLKKYTFPNQVGDIENLIQGSEVEFDNDAQNPTVLSITHIQLALDEMDVLKPKDDKEGPPEGMYS